MTFTVLSSSRILTLIIANTLVVKTSKIFPSQVKLKNMILVLERALLSMSAPKCLLIVNRHIPVLRLMWINLEKSIFILKLFLNFV